MAPPKPIQTKNPRARPIFCALLWTVAFAAAQGLWAAAAQSPEPKTVADFFLLVPEKYVGYDLRFREELLRGGRRGSVVDIPSGYISWDASDNPEAFEFVIFRKSNGRYIVAFNNVGDDFNRKPGDGAGLILLSYEGGRWRDVTRALLPVALDRKLGYKLPRRGRGIEVTGRGGRKLYTLTWADDRFRLDRSRR